MELAKELERCQAELKSLKEATSELAHYKQAYGSQEARLRAAGRENREFKKEIADLRQKNLSLEQEIADLRQKNLSLEKRSRYLISSISRQHDIIKTLREENERLLAPSPSTSPRGRHLRFD